ncbi:MAG: hypothetical protein ACFE8N_03485 [Promethearchaeota archaeon]
MTEAQRIFDMKLKNLILACKASGNYKKLAIVGYLSLCNLIDEIGIKLGVRPRRKEKCERLLEYMLLINEVFQNNLDIQVFKESTIAMVQEIELLYIRSQGDLPYKYIKSLYEVYYELRKLDIPNLYKNMSGEDHFYHTKLSTLNFFSRTSQKKQEDKFRPILLHKIREQQGALQNQLNRKLTSNELEKMIYLKKVKEGIISNGKKGVSFQGALKDSLDFEYVQNRLVGHALIGALFLISLIIALLVIELFINPFLMQSLTNLLLLLCGADLIVFFLYRSYAKRRR